MLDVRQMIKEFNHWLKKCKGISAYVVVEAEVISYRNMKLLKEQGLKNNIKNEFYDKYKEKEHRKFINYGILGTHLGEEVLEGDKGIFCIHLHGLLVAKNESTFDNALDILKSNKTWNEGTRRIEMKMFNEEFIGVNKPVTLSLNHISRYLFKAGTILNQGNPSLRYKIQAPNDQLTSCDEWLKSESKYDEFEDIDLSKFDDKKKNHTTDFLSLMPYEINLLAELNHTIINLNDTKTGNIIKCGHW